MDHTDEQLAIALEPPFIVVSFAEPHRILSWSMLRPGLQVARRVTWIEVRNKDLPDDVDAAEVIRARISDAGYSDAVVFVTSRDITRHHFAHECVEDLHARCLTTVGLSNSERVGMRFNEPPPFTGTINTLVHVAQPLSDAAMIEAISIATEARTTAVVDAGIRRRGAIVTGTGTDCIAVAAPLGISPAPYVGKHTAIGEAIGAAVYRATSEGIRVWKADWEAATNPVAVKAAAD